jgi:hypothetical protein
MVRTSPASTAKDAVMLPPWVPTDPAADDPSAPPRPPVPPVAEIVTAQIPAGTV